MVVSLADLHAPVQAGEFYKVPCVRLVADRDYFKQYKAFVQIGWMPVWPILHSDAEIGFPEQHYHLDWRFVSDEDLRYIAVTAYGNAMAAASADEIIHANMTLVITHTSICQGPEERNRRCYRVETLWPYEHRAPELLENLPRLKCAKLKDGRCPHWGFDLRTIQPDENGIIQCPGHGLCFKDSTGELVPRRWAHRERFNGTT